MKVALISTTPPPVGGIAKWTVRMLATNLEYGWSIVLVDDKPIDRESFGEKTKINIVNEIKRAFRVWKDLDRVIIDNEIKIVHACPIATLTSLGSAYIESIIAHHKKKKFIAHFRCTIPNMIGGCVSRFFLKKLCNNSDYIIVLNKKTEDYLKAITKNEEIEIVPNFVNTRLYAGEREINSRIKTAVYVGGVTEEKGCMDILETAKKCPEIDFKLIGKAEQKIKNEADLLDNVNLPGVLSSQEILLELRKADVFLFLSAYPGEGFSNALVEAMSSGLPCIVSDWAANADMIEDKGGIVVPIHCVEKVVEAIESMSTKDERMRMSSWNMQKAQTKYDERIITRRYTQIYNNVASL